MSLKSFVTGKIKGAWLLAFIFGFGYIAGDIFEYRGNLQFNCVTILAGFFLSFLFLIMFYCLHLGLRVISKPKSISVISLIKKHTYRNVFIILFILWLGHLIIKYPAAQCPDSLVQIQMGRGADILSAHYPLVSTLFISSFVKIGEKLGMINQAMFLYVLLETLIMAAIFARTTDVLEKKLEASDSVLLISILFFAFSPFIAGYVGGAIKDNYYSIGFVLLMCVLAVYWKDRNPRDFRLLADLLISSLFVCLFRKEGVIILGLCFIMLAILDISRYKRCTILLPSLLAAFALPLLINFYFVQKYNPVPAHYAEMLSIPFQQTARYVSKHQDIISEEEIAAIRKVFPYEELPKLYDKKISDQVKTSFNFDATQEELLDYFKAWAVGFLKAPLCYLRATAEQNIYLIYFGYNNHPYYIDANSGAAYLYGDSHLFKTPQFILDQQDEYLSFLEDMHSFPILNVINNMVFYIWLLFSFLIIALNEHNNFFLFLTLPLYLVILIIIAGPQVIAAVRYAFPIIWTFPIWLTAITYRDKADANIRS